jgi:glycosyltransferase involved in cell wall biosynthesis
MSPIAINGRFLTQQLTGVQRVATELVRALDALAVEGHTRDIRVVAPSGAAAPWLMKIALVHVGTRGGQAWEQLSLPGAARDALLLNLGNTAPLRAGGRQAVLIHDAGVFDTPESYSLAFRTWYRLLHRALVARGARILTVSAFSRGRLAHHLRLDAATIGIVPEGAEHILREPADMSVLDRHALLEGGYALAVGTGAAHKNLALLSAAAGWLAARGRRLAVAGARDAGVFAGAGGAAGAIALGRVSDAELRALYAHAACLLFPSRYEGFGLPPLEAMACGCPVVAARAASVPEVCGEAALWFDAASPESLIAALDRLHDSPGLADQLRADGLARAGTFTWRRAAETLLALVQPMPHPVPA